MKPGEYVVANLGPASAPRRRGTSKEVYGTVVFERELMRELITIGQFQDPKRRSAYFRVTSFAMGVWLGVVPWRYQQDVIQIAQEALNKYAGEKATDTTRLCFIEDLLTAIFTDLEPIHPHAGENQ
jgi:hypothetical protein